MRRLDFVGSVRHLAGSQASVHSRNLETDVALATWSNARLLLAASCAVLIVPPWVQAQPNCEWYGRTAVRQQQINEERQSGFSGAAWHKHLSAHMRWCGTVAPEVWTHQAQSRNSQLEACEKRQPGD